MTKRTFKPKTPKKMTLQQRVAKLERQVEWLIKHVKATRGLPW